MGLWDTTTRTLRGDEPFFVNEGVVISVALSPDGQVMAAGYQPGGMRADQGGGVLLFDTNAGKRLGEQAIMVDEGQVAKRAMLRAWLLAPMANARCRIQGGRWSWSLALGRRDWNTPAPAAACRQ